MIENFTLEMWLVLIAASSIASCLSGEMYGAWRVRKRLDTERAEMHAARALQALQQGSVGPAIPNIMSRVAFSDNQRPLASQTPRMAPRVPRAPRETFEHMPSLADVRGEAEDIRKSGRVWDARSSALPAGTSENAHADAVSGACACARVNERMSIDDPVASQVLHHYQKSIRMLDAYAALQSRGAGSPACGHDASQPTAEPAMTA